MTAYTHIRVDPPMLHVNIIMRLLTQSPLSQATNVIINLTPKSTGSSYVIMSKVTGFINDLVLKKYIQIVCDVKVGSFHFMLFINLSSSMIDPTESS